jgi:tRNA-dihydrouridine synthase
MIGRGAVRNPWIFEQIRAQQRGDPAPLPTGHSVRRYVQDLYETTRPPGLREAAHVRRLKKYLNYLGAGIEPTGQFLHRIRRVTTAAEFFQTCDAYLDHDQPLLLEAFPPPHAPAPAALTGRSGNTD